MAIIQYVDCSVYGPLSMATILECGETAHDY